ncbi:ABC transporter ATP-binding protein [Brenneria tiliae]|uniref:ABC transporter ATP-binding protein n=1 Tax=Brenneria tiliae TaxID=2914984 RepID=UPI002014A1AF|nr:ABC transporter ATP-binding protein [Brenneria tiliae]MCL2898411.1 ABC transporter ATP-binding protein [Brenneria tiliae]MCL2903047.1 ABC transporter ATP-binding protein [Brenneria tiliae]
MAMPPLLDVENMHVTFQTPSGPLEAIRGVSFSLSGQERVAVVGESGSGKSTIFNTLLGLLPENARVRGRADYMGTPLLGLTEKEYTKLRGSQIGMIVQAPRHGLEPTRKIGSQIKEMLRLHQVTDRRHADEYAISLLENVGIKEPDRVAKQYPHQISGGMGQRVMIAMILAAEPKVLIADEATSALDRPVRESILELLDHQIRKRGMGLVLISHDLDLVSRYADRVLVMYSGKIVEETPGSEVSNASHPYTRGLLASRPRLHNAGGRLPTLNRDASWLD